MPTNLLDFDRTALQALLREWGEKPYRAQQLMQWIYQRGVIDFDAMTDISKALRARLQESCEIKLPDRVLQQQASDGTHKWLLQTACGNRIETVYIPEPGRGTLCVSSQVGCALGCVFCSTAQQGFNRNLSVAEIIGQVWVARHALDPCLPITNVVMMGMGEPLLNFQAVVSAMNLMQDDFAYGLSKRRVTVSTSGVVPAIDQLRENSEVSLAVSLHAAHDELRDILVPINKKYPLAELLPACKRYIAGKKRKITFEYVMLEDVNDTPQQARMLAKLLSDIPSKINLIPFNPFPNTRYRCSAPEVIEGFQTILRNAGYITTVRKTRGDDIDAACGQLVGQVNSRIRQAKRARVASSCGMEASLV